MDTPNDVPLYMTTGRREGGGGGRGEEGERRENG